VPVAELKHRITYTEFRGWVEFLALEQKRETKQDHYLAQIAAEVRRSWVSTPDKVLMKDFLFKYEAPAPLDPKERMKRSKSAWGALAGIKIPT